jgi:hypothetical protein
MSVAARRGLTKGTPERPEGDAMRKLLVQELDEPRWLRLVDSQVTSTGAIIATYAPADLEGLEQITKQPSKASDTRE